VRNRAVRTQVRNAIKNVRQAEGTEAAQQALGQAVSVIDRGVKKRIMHRNTAARHKSRLTKLVQNMA
jgi:small subunit ribosomal protein S20